MTPKLNLPAPIAFLRDLFGGDFDTSDGVVVAPVGGIKLCSGDPEAVMLFIANLGTDTVFIRPKGAATNGNGIPLVAGSGTASMIVRDDGPLPTYDWYVTSNTGNQNVYFLRLSRYTNLDRVTGE